MKKKQKKPKPGTSIHIDVLPLVLRPRLEHGVDWGRPRLVLIRYGQKEVQLVPGHSTWSGQGSPWRYAPQHVIGIDYAEKYQRRVDIMKGQITYKNVLKHLEKIREFLGAPVFSQSHLVSKQCTLEVKDTESHLT